jgi:hypothetical protein
MRRHERDSERIDRAIGAHGRPFVPFASQSHGHLLEDAARTGPDLLLNSGAEPGWQLDDTAARRQSWLP